MNEERTNDMDSLIESVRELTRELVELERTLVIMAGGEKPDIQESEQIG